MKSRLILSNVHVRVGERVVCRGIDLEIPAGETHVLFGPNGSGKSSLLAAIMGLPGYEVYEGTIAFHDERIDTLPIVERARLGIGLAYQRPPTITGVSLEALGRALGAGERLQRHVRELGLESFLGRAVNDGFSGGEIKRWEILKLFLQDPALCLIDEPESGVDLEHLAAVGHAIAELLATPRADGAARSALVITHGGQILDSVEADRAYVLSDGVIAAEGEPRELLDRIRSTGYPSGRDTNVVAGRVQG